jgi:cell division protein FtsW (lipid II flippase)
LTLMLDTVLRWNNVSMGLSHVALIACAAGSCVMVTTADGATGVPQAQPGLQRRKVPWLLPLLYVLLALTLMLWAGMRYSSRSRRGRALFIFIIGIVLIVLASAFFFLRAISNTEFVGVGAAVTLLGAALGLAIRRAGPHIVECAGP